MSRVYPVGRAAQGLDWLRSALGSRLPDVRLPLALNGVADASGGIEAASRESPLVSIFWFKRDLRVTDNPALAAAAARGPVVPVYVVEPDFWALPEASARQYGFLCETLETLRRDLERMGSGLVVKVGSAEACLESLIEAFGAERLVSSEETGGLWTFARDRRVADMARGRGVEWLELPQSGVVRRLKNRDGWATARDRFVFGAIENSPTISSPALPLGEAVPAATDLGLVQDGGADRQRGGRDEAAALLDSFLTMRGASYRSDMSTPLAGETACSRLSPHLALGAISVRELAQSAATRQREVRGTREGWVGSLKSFQSRLAWRDHFIQKLEDAPDVEVRCLHSAYEDLRPRVPDTERLAAWQNGETGLPFVDACMRYLRATGWLNFRMRSMLVSVASYHLWLDWRVTGKHLARMFTDYEPGIHWSQMQMQSGVTGINTVRMYNPVKQGQDQDPDGVFTRRWLPELAPVPDRFLQEPWRWDGAGAVLGRAYPKPVIDVAAAAREARKAVWAVRGQAGFRDVAREVVRKHASRKDPQRRFANDRAPKARRQDPRQGRLDL